MDAPSLNMPYLLVAGSMVFAVVFGFAVINPAFVETGEMRVAINESRADLEERETFLRTLDSKVAELEINREHETRLATVLPREEQMEDALRILHRAGETAGVQIEQISNNTKAAQAEAIARQSRGQEDALPEGVLPARLDLTIISTYQGFRAFLTEIERSPRLMDVSSILLQANQEDPNVISVRMDVEFYTVSNIKGEL